MTLYSAVTVIGVGKSTVMMPLPPGGLMVMRAASSRLAAIRTDRVWREKRMPILYNRVMSFGETSPSLCTSSITRFAKYTAVALISSHRLSVASSVLLSIKSIEAARSNGAGLGDRATGRGLRRLEGDEGSFDPLLSGREVVGRLPKRFGRKDKAPEDECW